MAYISFWGAFPLETSGLSAVSHTAYGLTVASLYIVTNGGYCSDFAVL